MKISYAIKYQDIFINKVNTAQLTMLVVLIVYLFTVTLAPIGSVINARKSNLFLNKNSENNFYSSILKSNTRAIAKITTTTYINDNQMLARQIDNNNLQNYINNTKGSVLKLNNADNTNTQNYSYDAYGNIINVAISPIQKAQRHSTLKITLPSARNDGSSIPSSFQYNGERFDNNTSLQYLRARFYNPETKRFINQDSYDLLNRFGYVNSNPVINSDPTGNDTLSDLTDLYKQQYLKFSIPGTVVIGAALIVTCWRYWGRTTTTYIITLLQSEPTLNPGLPHYNLAINTLSMKL